ncbi:MAG TPA: carboxypeptidase-like regulatory domain-containing protein [bacterium]|nr:carboxypeptidase-like regulatory domain-containing protein [bacterium]
MKRLFIILSVLSILMLACDDNKKKTGQDSDPFTDDSTVDDTEIDSDATLPDDAEDNDTAVDENIDEPLDIDDVETPDFDTTACIETGEGCGEKEICLFVYEHQGYYCESSCDPLVENSCGNGLICEAVEGDTEYGCFLPVYFSGKVFDVELEAMPPIEGAIVSATRLSSGDSTEVSITKADGIYKIPLSLKRNRLRLPFEKDESYTLKASAKDYEPFPGSIRVAVPIKLDSFSFMSDGYYVKSGFLQIGLAPLPDEDKGGFTVSGSISEEQSGVLIIAGCDTAPCPYAYTGKKGDFIIFNVKPGDYEVRALISGLSFETASISVVDADITDVVLNLLDTPELGTISGSVNIVNAPGGSQTSVVLMAEETFIPGFNKGAVVPGLRAPEPPSPPNIDNVYSITGVPAGKYVVLAAFENDYLVRDPDPNISGTQIVHITFPDPVDGWNVELENFKITEAIEIISPGAETIEEVESADALIFKWKNDSSETHYKVELFNSLGMIIWEKTIPTIAGDADLELDYDGDPIFGYFQWRVTSLKTGAPISTSEDLRGLFHIGNYK